MEGLQQPLTWGREQASVISYHDIVSTAHRPHVSSKGDDLPYPHFALIYINQNGEVGWETSPSLGNSGKSIFTPDVRDRFLKTASIGGGFSTALSNPQSIRIQAKTEDINKRLPFSDPHYPSPAPTIWSHQNPISPTQLIPCDWQFHQNKRQKRNAKRRGQKAGDTAVGRRPSSPVLKRTPIRIGDEPRIIKYYEKAFDEFQQINCRIIAKAFIKLVEPRKQVNHPYNGRKLIPGSSSDERADPELTKPNWWPAGVTHKEPDHLLKPERIRLLIHILRELGVSHGITAEKLRDAGQDVRRAISPAERLGILDEIYTVRQTEEAYLKGEIGKDYVVYISQCSVEDTETTFDSEMESREPGESPLIYQENEPTWVDDNASREINTPVTGGMDVRSALTTAPTFEHSVTCSNENMHPSTTRPPPSREFCLSITPPQCMSMSRNNSYTETLPIQRQYDGSISPFTESDSQVRPGVPAQDTSLLPHNRSGLPRFPNQQALLLSEPSTPTCTSMWDSPIQSGPVYQPSY